MMFDKLEETAAHLERFGWPDQARATRETVRQATAALEAWWNAPLTLAEAQAWGGYSASQLRRLIQQGTILTAPEGGIRRRHVPVHPGHILPLETVPDVAVGPDIVQQIQTRRGQKSA